MKSWLEQLLAGNRRALARIISQIENRGPQVAQWVDALYPHAGHAFVVGITGPPGAGKSTVTDRLVAQIRKRGKKVAVVAVDPSSPFSGGAILGDRIRMQSHAGDDGVYVRSVGTRGKQGGLSHATREVLIALDAAKFDWILVETAGVGQTELDILKIAHAVCVVLVPESGDGIQVMKAGLMEIADLFVVNKSDRPEADKLVRELKTMVEMAHGKLNPVLKTQALMDIGIDQLYEAIEKVRVEAIQQIRDRNKQSVTHEIAEILVDRFRDQVLGSLKTVDGISLVNEVDARRQSPYQAAENLLKVLNKSSADNT